MKTFTAEWPQLFCLLDWWWSSPDFLAGGGSYSNGRKETDTSALPCCGIRSSAQSLVCKMFDALGKGNSWSLACFHLPFSPEQKIRPSRVWAGFLTTVCSWLPSLLGSNTGTFLCTCLCSGYLIGSTGRAEDLGALREVISKKDAFGPKISESVVFANDLFQWLYKP